MTIYLFLNKPLFKILYIIETFKYIIYKNCFAKSKKLINNIYKPIT